MTDEECLLAAVRAAPADDLPRLVYADWLEEHGRHDRAEFIRLQCEEAASGIDAAQRQRLHVLELMSWKWLADSAPGGAVAKLHRGFVHSVTCTAEQWVIHGDAIRVLHPIERVELTTVPAREVTVMMGDSGRDGCRLLDDPTARVFSYDDIRREYLKDQTGDALPALLRLRWPGVEFILPTDAVPSMRMPSYRRVRAPR